MWFKDHRPHKDGKHRNKDTTGIIGTQAICVYMVTAQRSRAIRDLYNDVCAFEMNGI